MVTIASAVSTLPDTLDAAVEACEMASAKLGSSAVTLCAIFFSPHHAAHAQPLSDIVRLKLEPQTLLGSTGEWIVGGAREYEDGPALSLWAASLPGAKVTPFRLRLMATDRGHAIAGFPDVDAGAAEAVLLIGDPFSFPAGSLLHHAGSAYPGLRFVGGMASGGRSPGENRLLSDANMFDVGAVGAVVSGDVRVETIVSQGCRGVGDSFVVTRAEGNRIVELASRPPLEVIRDTFGRADERDRQLLQQGLHVGVVVDEYKEEFGRGDFLVRNVVGADQSTGAIQVGEAIDVGRTIQFHVRDAESADEDLRTMLSAARPDSAGALLFTCNGRGSRLFGVADHDAGLVAGLTPEVAGMFCNGEVGPVGGRSFLHGFTASVALFAS